jgi:leucine dehydrogenase
VHGAMLKERGILYAPDYVINAGGVINVYQELCGYDAEIAKKKASGIHDTLLAIYKQADEQQITTNAASNVIAEQRIQSVKAMRDLRNTMDNQNWVHAVRGRGR